MPDEPSALTPRQQEVAELVAEGLSRKRIALALGISESSVKRHVENIAVRLGGDGSLRVRITRYVLMRPSDRQDAA